MIIVQRYYLKEFLRLFCLLSLGLSAIFSLVELLDKIDDFMPHNPPFKSLVFYAVFMFPKYLLYLFPLATLLSSLFVFSQAVGKKEIMTIKASGGKLKKLVMPFVFLGLFLGMLDFLIGEFIVPDLTRKAIDMKDKIEKKEKKSIFKEGTVWLKAKDNSIVKVGFYLPGNRVAKGIKIFRPGKDGFLNEQMDVREVLLPENFKEEGKWLLRDVVSYDLRTGSVKRFDELQYDSYIAAETLAEGIQSPEEMGIQDLYRYAMRLKAEGFNNTKLLIDLNVKISYPFINFFMLVLGLSLSLRVKLGGSLAAAATGLLIGLIYWFSYTMSLSLGYTAIFPPVASAWLIPVIFAAVSFYLFRGIPE